MPTHSQIIKRFLMQNPKNPCIATKEKKYSYAQIHALIEKHKTTDPIIRADSSLSTIISILRHLFDKKALLVCSPNEPKKYDSKDLLNNYVYLPTSGTQKQKIVTLSYDAIAYSALHQHHEFNLTQESIYALNLPLYHISGFMILIRSIMHGGCIALKESPLFYQSTHISMCTNQLVKILDKNHFQRLDTLLLGGGPISFDLCKKAYLLGYPLFITYGMSEMASQITTTRFCPKKPFTMGLPLKGRYLKMADDNTLLVKGKTLFKGYHHQATFIDHEGYFKSSDKVKITSHGLIIEGRIDRCIISGGENIHLDEIQKELLAIDGILEAHVSSRKDPIYENRPVAKCLFKQEISVHEIISNLKKKILKYKIPFAQDIYINTFFK